MKHLGADRLLWILAAVLPVLTLACGAATPAAGGGSAAVAAAATPSPGHGAPGVARLPAGVLASIPVATGPLGIAIGFGSVWVATHRDTKLYRIDPATNAVSATIDVGQATCGGPDIGFGRVWVGACQHINKWVAVDPATNQAVASLICGGLQIGFGAGSAWCPSGPGAGVVTRIDPATLKTVATIQVGNFPADAVFGDGTVWVANFGDGTVSRLDPATNKVSATIPAGLASMDANLTFAYDAAWLTPATFKAVDNQQLWRIDAGTNAVQLLTVAGVQDLLEGEQGNIADGLGSLWLETSDKTVSRLDPTTHRVLGTYPRQGDGDEAIGYGSLWLSNADFDSIWRVQVSN